MPRSKGTPSYTAVCRHCSGILSLVPDGSRWRFPEHRGEDGTCRGSKTLFRLPKEVFGE